MSNDIQAFWQRHYDELYSEESADDVIRMEYSNERVRQQTYSWILEAAGPIAGRRFLDVGCGAGAVALLASKVGAVVQGVDQSEVVIDQLRKKYPEVDWKVGDAVHLEQAGVEAQHDVVLAAEVLQYIGPTAHLATLWRFVRPGGRLVIVVPNSKCPIVTRTAERFPGFYAGAEITELLSSVTQLPQFEALLWRDASFQEDQRILPYSTGAWNSELPSSDASPVGNRFVLVAMRKI